MIDLLVRGGLSVSLIAPIYGLGICIVALLLWLWLDLWSRKTTDNHPMEVVP